MSTPRSELEVVIKGKDELTIDLQKLESKMIRFIGAISAGLATLKLGAAPIVAAAQFEDAMANVHKTVADTTLSFSEQRKQIQELGHDLLEMSLKTDISATGLAQIAASAGQQGLGRFGVEGVKTFTESVARMASVLEITAEQAVNELGKISNIFKILPQDAERAISIINKVADASTASGAELLDVIKRIGDAVGSLNISGATALAAAALDFGTSPEVAGSAFAHFFSNAFQKAEEFGKLMKVSATEWVNIVSEDGVKAFEMFNARIRELTKEDREKAIVKLVGGGRHGVVFDKFALDSGNAVLNRAKAAAKEGELGLSAIEEERVRLATLTKQVSLLRNGLFKLGAESAEALIGPLTQYTARLSQALQTDGFKHFVNEAVGALGDLITLVVKGAEFVAGLNVNWENFIRLGKAFAGLKLAEVLGRTVLNFAGLGGALKAVSQEGAAAAAAIGKVGAATAEAAVADTAAAAATKGNFLTRMLGIDAFIKKQEELTAAALARKKAEEDLRLAAVPPPTPAAPRTGPAQSAQAPAAPKPVTNADVIAAKRQAAAEATRLHQLQIEAETIADTLAAQNRAELLKKTDALEKASFERRSAIHSDFYQREKVLRVHGTEEQIAANKLEFSTRMEQERTSHAALIAEAEKFYAEKEKLDASAHAASIVRQQQIAAEAAANVSRLQTLHAEQIAAQQAVDAAGAPAAKQGPAQRPAVTTVEEVQTKVTLHRGRAEVIEQKGHEQQAALAQKLKTDLEAVEHASAVKRLQIEEQYQIKRLAIKATGTETGLKAARKEKVTLLADEATAYAASLADARAYHAERLVEQKAALKAELAAHRSAIAEALLQQRALTRAANASPTPPTTVGGAPLPEPTPIPGAPVGPGIAAGIAGVGAAAGGAATKVGFFEKAWIGARAALEGAKAVIAGVFTSLLSLGAKLLSAASWILIIYSIADAFHLFDNFGETWQKLTDSIGLTSKATRDHRVEQERLATEAAKLTRELEKQTKAYDDNTDAQTGRLKPEKVPAELQIAHDSNSRDQREKAIKQIVGIALATEVKAHSLGIGSKEENDKLIADHLKTMDGLKKQIGEKTAELNGAGTFQIGGLGGTTKAGQKAGIAALKKEISDLQKAYDTAGKEIETFKRNIIEGGKAAIPVTEDMKQLTEQLAASVTPKTEAAAVEFMRPIIEATEKRINLQKELLDLISEEKLGEHRQDKKGDPLPAVTEADITNKKGALAEANNQVTVLKENYDKFLASIRATVTPQEFGLFVGLKQLQVATLAEFDAFSARIKQAPDSAKTGEKAFGVDKPTSGDDKFTGKERDRKRSIDAANRALRKAERERNEEEIDAGVKLERQKRENALEEDQRLFDRGLLDLKTYHERRQAAELANSVAEIDANKRRLVRLVKDEADARAVTPDPKDLLGSALAKDLELSRIEKERVELNGRIAVLQERQPAATKAAVAAQEEAVKKLKEETGGEANQLKIDLVLPTDAPKLYQAILDQMLLVQKDKLTKLRNSGDKELVALADAIESGIKVEAFQKSLQPLQAAVDNVFEDLSHAQARLAIEVENGQLTSAQAALANSDTIKALLPALRDQLALMQQQFDINVKNSTLSDVLKQKEAERIDAFRLKLEQLQQDTDKTARDVNKSLESSLEGALNKLSEYGSSLKDVFKGLLLGIANDIKGLFFKDIAQTILKKTGLIGEDGTGGFGGGIQRALAGNKPSAVGATPGSSPLTPMYTKSVDPLPPGVPGSPGIPNAQGVTTFPVAPSGPVVQTDLNAAGDAAKAAGQSMTDASGQVVGAFGQAAASALTTGDATQMVGSLFTSLLGPAIQAISAAMTASSVKSVVAHTGGIIGASGLASRNVHPLVFAGAPRYHGGGTAGLKPGEVPAILKEGEAVLTQNQQSLVAASMNSGGAGEMNIRNVLVTDPNFVTDAMSTSQGERVLMTFITKNRSSIRQAIG